MTELITKDERDHLWDHFKFNADQRIKAFNFFVIISVFVNGGLFTAYDKNFSPLITGAIGIFIVCLAFVFYLLDKRSGRLTDLSIPGLRAYESLTFRADSKYSLFTIDQQRPATFVRYKFAFRFLYAAQALVGIAVAAVSLTNMSISMTGPQNSAPSQATCEQVKMTKGHIIICSQK